MRHPVSGGRARQTGKGRLALNDGPGNSGLFIILMAALMAQVDARRRQAYGDIDMSSIADMVGLAASDTGLRDVQRGINANSVAQATGIPRETVRRKLKRLVARDFIAEQTPGRYVIKSDAVQKPEHLAVYERCVRDAVAFMNECVERGLVKWEPDEAKEDRP